MRKRWRNPPAKDLSSRKGEWTRHHTRRCLRLSDKDWEESISPSVRLISKNGQTFLEKEDATGAVSIVGDSDLLAPAMKGRAAKVLAKKAKGA